MPYPRPYIKPRVRPVYCRSCGTELEAYLVGGGEMWRAKDGSACTNAFMHRPTANVAVQCSAMNEQRTPGRRYVNARWQCPNRTAHPSGYCTYHKANRYRWEDRQGV